MTSHSILRHDQIAGNRPYFDQDQESVRSMTPVLQYEQITNRSRSRSYYDQGSVGSGTPPILPYEQNFAASSSFYEQDNESVRSLTPPSLPPVGLVDEWINRNRSRSRDQESVRSIMTSPEVLQRDQIPRSSRVYFDQEDQESPPPVVLASEWVNRNRSNNNNESASRRSMTPQQNEQQTQQNATTTTRSYYEPFDLNQIDINFDYSYEPSPSPLRNETEEENDQAQTTKAAIPSTSTNQQPTEKEDSSWEMDTEDEENPLDDDDKSSFEQIRKGKIRMSQSLRKYFEKGIGEIPGAEDTLLVDVRKKFQILWLQYIIEFNSKFWSLCFGLEIDSVYSEPDFSKTTDSTTYADETSTANGSLTLKQRFDSIPTDNPSSNLEYQCSTENNVISDLLYKKKVWKKKFMLSHIRPLWAVLTNNATSRNTDGIDLSNVEKRVTLAPSKRMEFNVRLDITLDFREEEDIPKNENVSAIVNLFLKDVSYNEKGRSLRNRKLRFLIAVYENLAPRYCNWRIKQWIGGCQDVEIEAFNDSYKRDQKQDKRRIEGHPKWRKFKRKWALILKEREEMEERRRQHAKEEQEKAKARRLREEKKTPEEIQKELELAGNYGWPRSKTRKVSFEEDEGLEAAESDPGMVLEIKELVEKLVADTEQLVESDDVVVEDVNQLGTEIETHSEMLMELEEEVSEVVSDESINNGDLISFAGQIGISFGNRGKSVEKEIDGNVRMNEISTVEEG